jgi:hypothetical protein
MSAIAGAGGRNRQAHRRGAAMSSWAAFTLTIFAVLAVLAVALVMSDHGEDAPMKHPNSVPEMSAAEFRAALKRYGFGVAHARIVDTTGKCPGISWPAVLRERGGGFDRNATLLKVIQARDAEIARRALREMPD